MRLKSAGGRTVPGSGGALAAVVAGESVALDGDGRAAGGGAGEAEAAIVAADQVVLDRQAARRAVGEDALGGVVLDGRALDLRATVGQAHAHPGIVADVA